MDTKIYNSKHDGWTAETKVALDETRVLRIYTSKRSDKWIWTYASVHHRNGTALTHAIYQDYSKPLAKSGLRCTEKNVSSQHKAILGIIDTIIADVHRFYAKEPALVA